MSYDCLIPEDVPGISRVKKKITVQIDPNLELVPEEGVREALWKLRKNYMSALGGVLLDWKISKIRLQDPVPAPFLRDVHVKGVFTVFHPVEGTKLTGRVIETDTESNLLVAKSYGHFCVKIPNTDWSAVQVGSNIEYTLVNYSVSDNLAIITGRSPQLHDGDGALQGIGVENVLKIETAAGVSSRPVDTAKNLARAITNGEIVPSQALSTPKTPTSSASSGKTPKTPAEATTPAATTPKTSSSKRKSSNTDEEKASKKVKPNTSEFGKPGTENFGNLSQIVPLSATQKSAATVVSPSKKPLVTTPTTGGEPSTPNQADNQVELPAPDLAPGWKRIKHSTEKSSWYTFASPSGKVFKNLKLAKIHLSALGTDGAVKEPSKEDIKAKIKAVTAKSVSGEKAAHSKMPNKSTIKAKVKSIVQQNGKHEATVREILRKQKSFNGTLAAMSAIHGEPASDHNDESAREQEQEQNMDEEHEEENNIEPAQMSDTISMYGDEEMNTTSEVTTEMRSTLLDNLHTKLSKHKKPKKNKKNKETPGF